MAPQKVETANDNVSDETSTSGTLRYRSSFEP